MHTVLHAKNARVTAFRRLVETFSCLAVREGVSVTPYGAQGPVYFSALPPEQQDAILADFGRYVSVYDQVFASGQSLKDDSQVLWRMFHQMGVHPAGDLMPAIGSRHMIEIYNESFIQIFRNVRLFSICSYTLDELLSRPFWELFDRDPSITHHLVTTAKEVLAGRIEGVHHWKVGVHTVDELASPAKYHAVIENKIISPLHDASGRPVAFVHTFEIISCEKKA